MPAWIAELLTSIEKGPAARIAHVEYAQSISRAEGQANLLYQRIDRTLFPVGEDALQQVPLPTPLNACPHANGSVDVVLHLSRVSPTETDAPLGTWFFQPDLLLRHRLSKRHRRGCYRGNGPPLCILHGRGVLHRPDPHRAPHLLGWTEQSAPLLDRTHLYSQTLRSTPSPRSQSLLSAPRPLRRTGILCASEKTPLFLPFSSLSAPCAVD